MNGMQAMERAWALNKEFRDNGGDPRFVAMCGTAIRNGAWFWNNNLDLVRVDFARTEFGQHWDGWFATIDDNGIPSHVSNAERLTTRHPFTQAKAAAPEGTTQPA